eukprot:gene6195-7427_t
MSEQTESDEAGEMEEPRPVSEAFASEASASEDPTEFVVERSLNICNTSAARATFVAGYAYYELGRYSHSANLVAYPLALTVSFGLAVLSALVSASFSYFVQRASADLKGHVAKRLQSLVTLCVLSFELALLGNLVSFSLLGRRYFSGSALQDVPLWCAIFTGVLLLMAKGYLHSTSKVMHFMVQQCEQAQDAGASCPVRQERSRMLLAAADATALRAVLCLAFAQAGVARYQPALEDLQVTPDGQLNRLYLYSVTLSACLSLFSVFAATNIAIFLHRFPPGPQREAAQHFLRWFQGICEVTFAAALAFMMLAVAFMGWGCSYQCRGECQLSSEWDPQPMCTGNDGISAYATSGDCYLEAAYLPLVAGCLGSLICLGSTKYTWACEARAKAFAWQASMDDEFGQLKAELAEIRTEIKGEGMTTRAGRESGTSAVADWHMSAHVRKEDPRDMQDVDALLASATTFGGQATIIASTVFYNIVTFETDVLNPFVGWGWLSDSGEGRGFTFWSTSFLAANLLAFVGGLSCLFLAELFRGRLGAINSDREKRFFVNEILPVRVLLEASFYLSILGFFTLFAVMGLAKYDADDGILGYAMFAVAGSGGILTLWGVARIHQQCGKCQLLSNVALQKARQAMGANDSEYQRITRQIGFYAPRASFFGAFSYNACVFLYRWHLPPAHPYLFFMGISFMLSVAVLTWHTTWHVCLSKLHEEERKEAFARRPAILSLSRRAYGTYLFSLYFFLAGFSLFGWIKNDGTVCGGRCTGDDAAWVRFGQYAYIMAFTGALGLWFSFHSCGVAVGEVLVEEAFFKLAPDRGPVAPWRRHRHQRTTVPAERAGWEPTISMANSLADQTTFVAGNVFYQILFSQMQRDSEWEPINWVYFTCASGSLIIGVVTITFATMLAIWGSDVKTDLRKACYVTHCTGLVDLLFQFYLVSILLWIWSFTFLAAINYKEEFWITLGPGAFLATAATAVWIYARLTFHQVTAERLEDRPGRRSPLQQFFGGVLKNTAVPKMLLAFFQMRSIGFFWGSRPKCVATTMDTHTLHLKQSVTLHLSNVEGIVPSVSNTPLAHQNDLREMATSLSKPTISPLFVSQPYVNPPCNE